MTVMEKQGDVHQFAQSLFDCNPDWVTFYREVLGLRGAARQAFPSRELMSKFRESEEYRSIQEMLGKLREKSMPNAEEAEPTRVVTVRLPRSLHEALRYEAHEHHTSMNKLCISKLLQLIEEQNVPSELPADL